jgi:uncharacterized membrane protein YhhN
MDREGLMDIWLIIALLFAGLEVTAVRKGWRQLEFMTKPAVMVCLFFWLFQQTGLQDSMLWFGLGILFSLLGDVLLLVPRDRMFILGLVAFLITHICYLLGFQEQLIHPRFWSLILMFFIVLNGVRLLSRIVSALRGKRQDRLVLPIIVYGLIISLMLAAAMSTLSDPTWKAGAALSVSAGAFLFWGSDLMLAWNKFVSPLKSGRFFSILAYHLGQIGLIAGVISQFR